MKRTRVMLEDANESKRVDQIFIVDEEADL
jgi:hypothetical protein